MSKFTVAVDPNRLRANLEALQIRQLAEWDVLTFIYRHGISIADDDQIARLLGHGKAAVRVALDSLTSTGLLKRSRASRGVRAYQLGLVRSADSRRGVEEELMKLAGEREGRLALIAHFRQANDESERQGHGGLHLA